MIDEIVVISGKGGTGKTTLTASIIPYFEGCIVGDCDVDAPDLDILFDTQVGTERDFIGLQKASLDKNSCINCGKCGKVCKFNAISGTEINPGRCEGCGVCEYICPTSAITMVDVPIGKLYTSDTPFGEMVHARLTPGEEASGKLVAEVRRTAKGIAEKEGKRNILVDGSPGVACNVISSITGAKKVIIVTEPTFSGIHDLRRVYELSKKFRLRVYVVINKYDISLKHTQEIERYCEENGISMALKIPFKREIVEAITEKKIPSVEKREIFQEIGFFEFVERLKRE